MILFIKFIDYIFLLNVVLQFCCENWNFSKIIEMMQM